jgi:hypothetical protein
MDGNRMVTEEDPYEQISFSNLANYQSQQPRALERSNSEMNVERQANPLIKQRCIN